MLKKSYFFMSNWKFANRLKIIIKNGESVETFHNAGDVVVLPKSKLVRRFSEYGSLIEEYKLVDKKITLEDDLDNDQTEIVVTLLVKK
jgi:hypothetical protein